MLVDGDRIRIYGRRVDFWIVMMVSDYFIMLFDQSLFGGKMKRTLLFIISALLIPTLSLAVTYDHKLKKGKMEFEWKVDGKDLHIKVRAKTKGWVGIGFNPSKKMKGANILIGRVKSGKASVRDDWGTSTIGHSSDKKKGGKKNVSNVSGSEKGGFTELMFTIPLDSGDSVDTVIQPKGETTVILAYGRSDSYRLGHKFVTTLKVNLETGKFK